jgi:WD40 repeat protein
MATYGLQAELTPPHQQDVKAVLAISDHCIASCSRDGSVAVWERVQQNGDASQLNDPPFRLKNLLGGHHAYVNSLAYVPSSRKGGKSRSLGQIVLALTSALLASGGNSAVILLHSLTSTNTDAEYCLIGHSLNVCALEYNQASKRLMSGSWDFTARLWSEGEGEELWSTEIVLEGHQAAVWGVEFVQNSAHRGSYLTGEQGSHAEVDLIAGSGVSFRRKPPNDSGSSRLPVG